MKQSVTRGIRRNLGISIARLAILFLAAVWHLDLSAQTLLSDIKLKRDPANADQLIADIHLPAAGRIAKVRALANGKEAGVVKYLPFSEIPDQKSVVLVVFDASLSMARALPDVRKQMTALSAAAQVAGPNLLLGLGTFSDKLTVIAPPGAVRADFEKAVQALRADGRSTELYRSVLEAVRLLDGVPASRKFLLLISDGKAEDVEYDRGEAVAAARKAGVTIWTFGYPANNQGIAHLQSLTRLAEETGGREWRADDRSPTLPGSPAEALVQAATATGRILIVTKDLALPTTLTILISTESGETYSIEQKIESPAAAPSPSATPLATEATEATATPTPAPAPPPETLTRTEKVVRLIKANPAIAAGIVGGGLLALVLLAAFLWRKPKPASVYYDATVLAEVPPLPRVTELGWLDELDGSLTRHPLRKDAIRIGRGADNDIVLANDSVSKHHAEIHRKRDGTICLTDLNSGNGVLVNGRRVNQCVLATDDLVELGEVRFRFRSGQGAAEPSITEP